MHERERRKSKRKKDGSQHKERLKGRDDQVRKRELLAKRKMVKMSWGGCLLERKKNNGQGPGVLSWSATKGIGKEVKVGSLYSL